MSTKIDRVTFTFFVKVTRSLFMRRVTVSALVALAVWTGASAQELPVLRLEVSVPARTDVRFPSHVTRCSSATNPATAAPRRVVTSRQAPPRSACGRASTPSNPMAPSSSTDAPSNGCESVEVVAGRDTTLALTADASRRRGEGRRAERSGRGPNRARASRGSRFWPRGRRARSSSGRLSYTRPASWPMSADSWQRASAPSVTRRTKSVEVQVSQAVKVTGAVIVADRSRDVAVVRVHPSAIDGIRPVPLACDATDAAPVDPDRYVIDVPLFGPKDDQLVARRLVRRGRRSGLRQRRPRRRACVADRAGRR